MRAFGQEESKQPPPTSGYTATISLSISLSLCPPPPCIPRRHHPLLPERQRIDRRILIWAYWRSLLLTCPDALGDASNSLDQRLLPTYNRQAHTHTHTSHKLCKYFLCNNQTTTVVLFIYSAFMVTPRSKYSQSTPSPSPATLSCNAPSRRRRTTRVMEPRIKFLKSRLSVLLTHLDGDSTRRMHRRTSKSQK